MYQPSHSRFLVQESVLTEEQDIFFLRQKGQLIGLAFDGNWEAMSGDVAFEPELQRTIAVDIRYVLFIIEHYGQAKWLIDELSIK